MAEDKKISVAIIGYGLSFHTFHVPFISSLPELYTLRAIVQRHPTASSNAALDYPQAKAYTSTTEMLASEPDVELVVISSIPATHYGLCKEILAAGKHVVCEKPFVATSAEAQELASLAAQTGKLISVYQNRRWDSDFLTLRNLLNEQALGRIVDVESHFDRHRPHAPTTAVSWKAQDMPANGAIYDLGAHLLDQFVVAFGVPDRITAFVGDQRVYTVAGTGGDTLGGDSFTVHFHYDNFQGSGGKLLATARAGVVSAEMRQLRWWVRGTEGSFYKANLDVQEDQLKAGMRPNGFVATGGRAQADGKGLEGKIDAKYGREEEDVYGTVTKVDHNTGEAHSRPISPPDPPVTYKRFYELLGKAIRGTGQNPVGAEEAARTIRLIELALQSSQEQRTIECDIDW